ncbi:MAG: cupin domain-containing protein [Candidatus Eremiobacteraeota bacterium]|nr:cupin domain-containing protein [Candidatus Eremiobacteraeota bacterium]
MKFFTSVLVAAILTAAAGAAISAAASNPMTFTPDNLNWVAGTGPTKGTWAAILVGNPTKSGTAIVRVKMPDGYTNKPHYHVHDEYITVISGIVLFGTGDAVNKANAKVLPAGSFIMVPAGVHHWSMAKGETIVQVGGEGPQTNVPIKSHSM